MPQVAPTPTPAPQPSPQYAQPPAYPQYPAQYPTRRRGGLLPAAERMLRAALEATAAANERRNMELQTRAAYPGAAPIQAQVPPAFPQPPANATPAPNAFHPPAAPAQPPALIQPVSEELDILARRREQEHRREADLERRLVDAGLSPRRAAKLVGTAISRRGPFSAESDLADEVRHAIFDALPAVRLIRPGPGAVAIVGAGGSGKTRCVAALAAAHARAGEPVSVASFGAPTREDELGELLHGESVNVIPAMRTNATARSVASARERGLVIVDTASPGETLTIDAIAEALRGFDLDAIYLAVPATLSGPAGVKLVDRFSAFDLTGLVATHVDEADQLGVIAELAMQTGIPIAYTHTGLDLQTSVTSADALRIASSLL